MLLLEKLQASSCKLTKSNTPPWVFFTFLDCTNGTKLRNASLAISIIFKTDRLLERKLTKFSSSDPHKY